MDRPTLVTALELNENGLPVVSVNLHDKGGRGPARAFRFALDTAAGISLAGPSIPESYLIRDGYTVNLKDAEGRQAEGPGAFLKRVELGGIVRDDVAIALRDLEPTWGFLQDHPVDGILGMNFLNGTRFTLDCPNRRILWWERPAWAASGSALGYDVDRIPHLLAQCGQTFIPCAVDTGSMDGIGLPASVSMTRARIGSFSQGILGQIRPHGLATIPEITLGGLRWRNLEVGLEEDTDTGTMGMGVLAPGKVHFDFIIHMAAFEPRQDGIPPEIWNRRSLPIGWDRSGRQAFLKVFAVPPGSELDRLGCRVGDQLVQVAHLTGKRLTRRTILDFVRSGQPHAWIVRRDGVLVRLHHPGTWTTQGPGNQEAGPENRRHGCK
jgi:hypothetical protein